MVERFKQNHRQVKKGEGPPIREREPIPNLIVVNNLTYQYPGAERLSLDNISFTISEGEAVGIVGDSGSGKSTLLWALNGFIPHIFQNGTYEGEVFYNSQKVAKTSMADLMTEFGLVFQDPETQSFGMHIDDAIAFGMENMAVPRKKMLEVVESLKRKLKINHLTGKNMEDLSGGELQATTIASIWAMSPKVVMIDEGISALDAGGQERMKSIIRSLIEEEQSMVIVDSDVQWLSDTVDRILVLEKGKLVYDGQPKNIFRDSHVARAAGVEIANDSFKFREAAQGPNIISVEELTFSYNETRALKNVCLDIKTGSCTAIVGPNGSGKTTLAKVISGILSPQKGKVTIDGITPDELSVTKLAEKVGYVYQTPSKMFVADTVEEELNYGRRDEKVDLQTLERFGLSGLEDKSPYSLSSGQQQRLAIAAVIARDPDILILDEPTLGQTRENRKKLIGQIEDLQNDEKTVILISHDMNLVAQAAENVHVLNSGHVIRSGPAKEVLTDRQFFNSLGLPLPW